MNLNVEYPPISLGELVSPKSVAAILTVLFCALALAACGGGATSPAANAVAPTAAATAATAVRNPAVSVSGAWLRMPLASGTPGAGYLMVRNSGPEDRLIGAESDIAAQVEMHESMTSGGMMQMTPVRFITIPAGGQAELKPGGYHLMLIGIKRVLKAGEQATLSLKFENAGMLFVAAQVRE